MSIRERLYFLLQFVYLRLRIVHLDFFVGVRLAHSLNRLFEQFLLWPRFFAVPLCLLLVFCLQALNLLVQILDLSLPLAELDVLLAECLGRSVQLALQVSHAGLVLCDLLLSVLELPGDALDFVVVLEDHLVGEVHLLE